MVNLNLCLLTFSLSLCTFTAFADDLVAVNYYAESLCPDCLAFSKGPMNVAIDKVGSIFTLTYVPSGNAKLQSDGTLKCQHGPMECLINKVDACLLHYYPDRKDFWPFIHCMDEEGQEQDLEVGSNCAKQQGLDWDKIKTCTDGSLGTQLQMMAYNTTANLEPPHRYTPWVTVNGKHDAQAEGFALISVICKAYTGPNKPDACSSL
ncbi:PREDICTED: gamma-interferon-inducible lysosomal thiol reductase-like [Amphimedon queenslandica]|uniref:Saposin A-type domain-containing protein n=1 Tax=Amphimedon queenslandica TaxID=400682 RepID=A0A1X7UC10_AMPQE|nr:PREDICTED: gamma-interferon-inducible lysosomal thiol reductase-like [Amphimedon queenslandica]|eukprot:XP_003388404.1 PREDICTED: gamma-interferon-inducible lysosomal thiol reductase-like [Amphimedon queenslandica]